MANDNNIVLDETKKVLEIMRDSEEKVVLLDEDLRQNEILCEQIQQNLKELRDLYNKNTADFEDRHNLKNDIKKYNSQLLNFAQHIYTCGQELYTDVHRRESELVKNEELLEKNEENFLKKLDCFKLEEEKLANDIKIMKIKDSQVDESKELEHQMLAAECDKLKDEIKNMGMEIGTCQSVIKQCDGLDQQDVEDSADIKNLQDCLGKVDSEIDGVSKLLDEIEKYKETTEKEAENCISNIDKKLEEAESEIGIRKKTFEDSKIIIEELLEKIAFVESGNKEKEEELDRYDKEITRIELCIKETKENSEKEVANCEMLCLENEKMYMVEEGLQEKLKTEISSYKTKIEEQDEEIHKIAMEIAGFEEKISKIDLNEVLEGKQNEVIALKATRQSLKEDYNKKLLEIQTEVKRIQEEVDLIEASNKNLQDEIDKVVLELEKYKGDQENKLKEKQRQEEVSKELDGQIQKLMLEINTIKAEIVRNKEKTERDQMVAPAPKPLPVPTSSKGKKPSRHWDSDSSIEGENRRFSELAKKKLKLKKLQAKKS